MNVIEMIVFYLFFYTPCYYLFNKFRDEREVRNRTIILYRYLTHSFIDLLTMAVIRGRCWSTHFFKLQVGSGSKSHDLFGDLIIISLTSTSEVGWSISSIFPLSIIYSSMEIFQVVWNDIIPEDCCFPYKIIAEFVSQEFSRGETWKIYMWVISHQVLS